MSQKTSRNTLLLVLGVVLVSFNLRPSITAVGPLIPMIREELGLSNAWAGFLTTLPLVTFATFSIFSAAIGRKLGNARAIFLGMLIIGIGTVIRVAGGSWLLFLGTGLTGVGIVIGNVLLIPFIKTTMPHKIGLMTSIYTTGMTLLAAVASGVSIPLATIFNLGWRGSLLSWIGLIVIGLLVWLPQIGKKKMPVAKSFTETTSVQVWKSKLGWQVSLFMGIQSFIFFSLITWLPDLLITRGFSPSEAGWIIMGIQVIGLAGAFTAPLIAVKFKDQVGLGAVLGLAYIIGFSAFFAYSETLLYVGLTLVGFCLGSSISLAYTLIGLRTMSDATTSSLSGMSQSIGYFLAAVGPLLVGILFDLFGNWDLFIWLMILASAIFLFLATKVGRPLKI
ncbi:MFS transporter [Litoribacter alkaliphilus]|uniref:MFS transporter n=1 Tax=Litoribacter ruber TaxID=702568 RepID=A0AAP2CIG7_9BACT|nr:MFS transporter [Litoribacter alkaliphilus]MBS9524274.1 MFS transporter [Litoribacter alkaliphilus]